LHHVGSSPLDGVRPRLVKGTTGGDIVPDFSVAQMLEINPGRHHVAKEAVPRLVIYGKTGDHLVGDAGKLAQHPLGVVSVLRLSHDLAITEYNGVGADEKAPFHPRGHFACLVAGKPAYVV